MSVRLQHAELRHLGVSGFDGCGFQPYIHPRFDRWLSFHTGARRFHQRGKRGRPAFCGGFSALVSVPFPVPAA